MEGKKKGAALFRVPVYSVLLASSCVALWTLSRDPSLLYRVTREDGSVEWATVAAMLALAVLLARHLLSPPPTLSRGQRMAGWALALLALAAAGEEISWGQRIFGFETGQTMQTINLQRETNLHNLIPGTLFNGIIVFSLGIGFVLVPIIWRARSERPPLWLPSAELSLLMLDAILINHYRFATAPERVGIVVLLLLLAQQTLSSLKSRNGALLVAACAGWVTVGCHYHAREVLRATNHQYEIRELLIVILGSIWADQTLRAYTRQAQAPTEGSPLNA